MGFITRLLSRFILWVIGFVTATVMAGAVGLTLFALTLLPDLPSIDSLDDIELKVPLRVFASDSSLIAEYGEERRVPVSIDDVPDQLVNAILSAEDDGFYDHPGISISGVIRAAMANIRSRGSAQGASTITMQVARNYFLTREKTYTRKLKEVLLSLRLERALTKDQILELYLNKIFLGHRAYGFAAASNVYYGKGLKDLALPQLAMLAALPKAPSTTNPLSNPRKAKNRRNYVLQRMHDSGHISIEDYSAAKETALTAEKYVARVDLESPYVAEMVRQYIIERFGEAAYESGYRVYTTIVPDYQLRADAAVRRGILTYEKRHGWRGPAANIPADQLGDLDALASVLSEHPTSHEIIPAVVLDVNANAASLVLRDGSGVNLPFEGMKWARRFKTTRLTGPKPKAATDVLAPGMVVYVMPSDKGVWQLTQLPTASSALVSLSPEDGAIKAISGGFDYYLSKFNRATQAERQPGSNIKPFIYAAAIDKGFTAASTVSGAPITIKDPDMEDIWRPENYNEKFEGPTRIRAALKRSLNLVSVRLLRAIGPGFARVYLERFGFNRDALPNGLSLALGSASATPLEMATAYAVIANGGFRIQPYLITRIEDRDGNIIEVSNPAVVCRDCPQKNFDLETLEPQEPLEESRDAAGVRSVTTGLSPTVEPGAEPRTAPRVVDEKTMFIMQTLLREVVNSGTATKAKALGRKDLGGKTGTTNNFKDAWFSGFSPQLHTTVWFGFDQPSDLGRAESGSKAGLPIWIDYMKGVLKDYPEKPIAIPPGIVSSWVSKETGEATAPNDPGGLKEYFVEGTEPQWTGSATTGIGNTGSNSGLNTGFGTTNNLPTTSLPQPGSVFTPAPGTDPNGPAPSGPTPAPGNTDESLF